jgi:hypothetical protein
MLTKTIKWEIDYYKRYIESEKSKTLNMFDFGIQEIASIAKQCKRGLIRKSEYNYLRKQIEKQLLRIN